MASMVAEPRWLDEVRALDGRRGHAFLPVSTMARIPPIGSTDSQGLAAVARVRYFAGGSAVWYVTELDKETGEAFGWAEVLPGCGELGYLSLQELGTLARAPLIPVERDLHWKSRPLNECPEVKAHEALGTRAAPAQVRQPEAEAPDYVCPPGACRCSPRCAGQEAVPQSVRT